MNEEEDARRVKEAELRSNFEKQCQLAADSISEADVLLLVTGAGWSADSGLAVYNDVAKVPAYERRNLEYSDICQPACLDKEPALFYGFWGQCFNDYRNTKPHGGYDIVCKWRNDKDSNPRAQEIRKRVQEKIQHRKPFDSSKVKRNTPFDVPGLAGAFYCFTSNCDGHFYDYLEACELHDCHGNVELWQCSNRDCAGGDGYDDDDGSSDEGCGDDGILPAIWRAPLKHEFVVDKNTMLAPEKKGAVRPSGAATPTENQIRNQKEDTKTVAAVGKTKGSDQQRAKETLLRYMPSAAAAADEDPKERLGWYMEDSGNWPECARCHSLARPAVFMFGDFGWKYDMSQSLRWDMWRETILEIAAEDNVDALKVCVVEVGCGMRVQTCRATAEQMVQDMAKANAIEPSATLVRINPYEPFPSSDDLTLVENTIPIMSTGLSAIRRIDELYMQKKGESSST